jgi:hypothetical protein
MRRPLDWFVIALSLAFLGLNHTSAFRTAVATPVSPPVMEAKSLSFEAAGRLALPQARHAERNLEFGYVTLDGASPAKATTGQLLN